MSGPKSYSVSVFDKNLSALFKVQSEMQQLVEEIRELSINDSELGINLNCDDFLAMVQEEISQLKEPFTIDYTGRISQRIYRDLKFKLRKKTDAINQMVKQLQEQQSDIEEKRSDYDAFVKYDRYYKQSTSDFRMQQSQLLQHLAAFSDTDFADEVKQAAHKIEAIKIPENRAAFHEGFMDEAEQLTARVMTEVDRCRSQMREIRADVNDLIGELAAEMDIAMPVSLGEDIKDQAVADKVRQINEYVMNVPDNVRRQDYQQRLNRVAETAADKDVYYFVELFDEIKATEKGHRLKSEVQDAIATVSKIRDLEEISEDRVKLLKQGAELLAEDKIDAYRVENLTAEATALKKRSQQAEVQAEIKQRERQFVKDQVVKGLKSFNYQVMDDMQVVDFEKQNDFMLTVPGQENYVNLRFNEDGSMLYNFLIPEDKQQLSVDQKKKKTDEMEAVCGEFKEVLNELREMGVDTKLTSEILVGDAALISVPKKYRHFIEERGQQATRRVVEEEKRLSK